MVLRWWNHSLASYTKGTLSTVTTPSYSCGSNQILWPRGATVACLTPDQKVACSNHVGVGSVSIETYAFFEQSVSKNELNIYRNVAWSSFTSLYGGHWWPVMSFMYVHEVGYVKGCSRWGWNSQLRHCSEGYCCISTARWPIAPLEQCYHVGTCTEMFARLLSLHKIHQSQTKVSTIFPHHVESTTSSYHGCHFAQLGTFLSKTSLFHRSQVMLQIMCDAQSSAYSYMLLQVRLELTTSALLCRILLYKYYTE